MWVRDQAWQATGQGGQIPVGSPKALCPPCAPLAPATRSTHIHQQPTRWCLLPTLRGGPVLSAALLHLRALGQHRPRPARVAPNVHPQICFGSGWAQLLVSSLPQAAGWGPFFWLPNCLPGPGLPFWPRVGLAHLLSWPASPEHTSRTPHPRHPSPCNPTHTLTPPPHLQPSCPLLDLARLSQASKPQSSHCLHLP